MTALIIPKARSKSTRMEASGTKDRSGPSLVATSLGATNPSGAASFSSMVWSLSFIFRSHASCAMVPDAIVAWLPPDIALIKMAEPRFDVLGIGNAIVDVMARTEEDFLVRQKLVKGSMRLVEPARIGAALRADGPGDRGLGRLRRQHGGGRRLLRRPRRLHRQGRRRPARPHLPPRHACPRHPFRHAAAQGRRRRPRAR